MLNKKIVRTILLSSVFNMSYAMINIQPTLMSLSDENNSNLITVTNPNDHKSYISMEASAFSCKNKEFYCKDEERVPYENIKDKLIFSMPKFILNPKQSKKIYVSWDGELPEQNLQIVYYASDHAKEAITKKTTKAREATLILDIITREEARILAFKAGAKEKEPIISSKNGKLTIQNTGSALLLLRLHQSKCPKDNKICKQFSRAKTIQPDSTQEYEFDSKYDVIINYFYNNEWKKKHINHLD